MDDFRGKAVVVTGGAQGLGGAVAAHFAKAGADLVILDLDEARGAAHAEAIGASFVRGDVTREEDIAGAVGLAKERFGRLDVMVNNAGLIGAVGPLAETAAEDWRATIAVHLDATFYGMKHAGRLMREQRSGSIISTASVAGIGSGLGPHAYVAAKAAIVALTRSVAAEYAAFGVRVNAVAPGVVMTPMIQRLTNSTAKDIGVSPLGVPVTADDIARAMLFLASDHAATITGQTLPVDGGLLAGAGGASRFHNQDAVFVR